jgi:hypothetical protein
MVNKMTDPATTQIIAEAKKRLTTLAVHQIMSVIISKIPLMGVGIFNPILSFFVGKVVKLLIEQTELGLYFMKVDIVTHKEAADFNSAVDKLEGVKENGNSEEISKAEQEAIDAFKRLGHFGNHP